MLLRGGGGKATSPRPPPLTCPHHHAVDPQADDDDAHGPLGTPRLRQCISLPPGPHCTALSLGVRGEEGGQASGEPPSAAQTPIGAQCHPWGTRTDRQTAWADAGEKALHTVT